MSDDARKQALAADIHFAACEALKSAARAFTAAEMEVSGRYDTTSERDHYRHALDGAERALYEAAATYVLRRWALR